MATRRLDIDTTVTTSTQPSATNASAADDIPNYAQVQDEFCARSGGFSQITSVTSTNDTTIQNIRDITEAKRSNNMVVALTGQILYQFDADSTASDDGDTVLQPTSGSGRWIKFQMGSGGAGGGAGIQTEEAHTEISKTIPLERGDNVVRANFEVTRQSTDIEGFLLEDAAAAGAAATIVWNPTFLDSANKDSDFEAGYLAVSGTSVANIDTNATTKIGASTTSWDKTSGTVLSVIQHDIGAANAFSLAGHRTVMAYMNLASVTNLSKVIIRMTDEADNPTNYATFEVDASGYSTGWTLVTWDLDGGGSTTKVTTGTGWSPESNLLRTFAIGVETTTTTQTYTDILFDSLVFISDDGDNTYFGQDLLAQKGKEYSFIDSSNREEAVIDSASSAVYGAITLSANLTNTFVGGTASTVRRWALDIGDRIAEFNTEAALTSGASDLAQDLRMSKTLPESIANGDFNLSVNWDTDLWWVVTAVPTGTTIDLEDPSDYSAQIPNGTAFHIINVYNNDSEQNFAYEADITSNGAPSHSSGTTTVTVADSSSVSVGDILLKKDELNAYISLVNATANESFGSALAVNELRVDQLGLQYPGSANIFGHWTLGKSSTEAIINRSKGDGRDASVVGTIPSYQREFFNGQFGSGAFSTSNYYTIPHDLAIDADSASLALSLWVYKVGAFATGDALLAKSNGSTAGWELHVDATGHPVWRINHANTHVATATFNADTWNHVAVYHLDSSTSYMWINGAQESFTSGNATAVTNDLRIGVDQGLTIPYDVGYMADLVIWSGYQLTDNDVQRIRNAGNHRILGNRAGFTARYEKTSQAGQRLSGKVVLNRTTNAVEPFLKKATLSQV